MIPKFRSQVAGRSDGAAIFATVENLALIARERAVKLLYDEFRRDRHSILLAACCVGISGTAKLWRISF